MWKFLQLIFSIFLALNSKFTVFQNYSYDAIGTYFVSHKTSGYNGILEFIKYFFSYILDEGAWVFVAGNSKNMPGQVRKSVVRALAEKIGDDKAEEFVENMEQTGKYQTETWS